MGLIRDSGGIIVMLGLLAIGMPAWAAENDDSAIRTVANQSANDARAITTARLSLQSGKLLEAAAALERRLLDNSASGPSAGDVRVWYATVLCWLDDPQGARSELRQLDHQPYTEDAWGAMIQACGPQSRPLPPTAADRSGISGTLAAGLSYDSDSSGPLSLQSPTTIAPKVTSGGLAATASARIDARSRAFYDRGGLYGGLNAALRQSVSGQDQKFAAVGLQLGFGRLTETTHYALGAVVRHQRQGGQPYLWEYGGQASYGLAQHRASRIMLRSEAVYQQFSALGSGPGPAADGWRYDLALSYEKSLPRNRFFSIGIAAEGHRAQQRQNGYFGGRISAFYQGKAGNNGAYFNLLGTFRYVDYTNNPPFQDRQDSRVNLRASYGTPLQDQRLILEASAAYTKRIIAVSQTTAATPLAPLPAFGSFGAELRLVWKFGKRGGA